MGTVTNVSERQLTTLPTINRSITDFTKLSPYAGGSNSFLPDVMDVIIQ